MSRTRANAFPLLITLLVACGGGRDAAEAPPVAEPGGEETTLAASEGTAAGGPAATEIRAAASPREVVIRARDFSYDAPHTIAGGVTTIRLINEGPDFHHLQLVRLEQGRTVDDLMRHLASGPAPWPSWAIEAGGPMTPPEPGEERSATLDLKPGHYALICFIPSPDGRPHFVHGMVRPLTVVPPSGPARTMPEADLVMTLDDYSFVTDRPITPGVHTIRVVDAAEQAHEVVIVRLEPGRSAADFLGWVQDREGSPPGRIVGGATGLVRGEDNVITVRFERGRYALLCFVPDHRDGRPHVAHGMVQEIEVG